MSDLRDRPAAYEVMRACLDGQLQYPPRGRMARIFGLSPIRADNASWFTGALGELAVARQLAQLGPEWTVLHSIPVGTGDSDIDHLLIGPAGVFTLNTKRHVRKKIWVGDQRILVAGQKVDHLRNSRAEALRASKLLSQAVGRSVPVTPALVFVAVAEITTRSKPHDVHIVTERTLLRHLRKLKPTMTLDAVAAITEVASRPSTWSSKPAAPLRHSLSDDFAALQREESAALWVRRGWGLSLLGVAAIVAALVVLTL